MYKKDADWNNGVNDKIKFIKKRREQARILASPTNIKMCEILYTYLELEQ